MEDRPALANREFTNEHLADVLRETLLNVMGVEAEIGAVKSRLLEHLAWLADSDMKDRSDG